MSKQSVEQTTFDFFSRLPVVVEPAEAQLSSDIGILPIRQFDDQIGYTQRFTACLNDPRDPDQIDHPLDVMVRQRLYGILAGYEDCNDHDSLRGDPVFKIVSGRAPDEDDLASQPTLSRFENIIDIASLWQIHDFFIDDFLRSFDRPPEAITLDLDAVDDACHGQQQLAFFHAFYDQYQYLPLVISCAETKQILWVTLRPGNVHAALGADDDIEYVVRRIRAAWPDVVIHVRGDAGCGVPWMYAVCERLDLFYTFGLSANCVLKNATEFLLKEAVTRQEQTGESQRLFTQFLYRAGSWKHFRRVIVKAECNRIGTNRRFIVTNRPGAAVLPGAAYDDYAERGESENRNKELKEGVSADRLSCHRFVANYFRLQLHAAALNLVIRMRAVVSDPPTLVAKDDPRLRKLPPEERANLVPVEDPTLPVAALAEPERRRYQNYRRRKDPLGEGHLATWRTFLIKVAGEVVQSTRRILIRIPTHWPYLRWFQEVSRQLDDLRRSAQVQT
jgi:hypothetical protein